MTEKRNINDNLFYTSYIIVELEGVCIQNNFEEEFIRQHIEEYVHKFWADKLFQEFVQTLREQTKLDEEQKLAVIPEGEDDGAKKAVITRVLWLMENKKVIETIENMQKEIRGLGYKSGNLKVKLSDSVDICLKTWNEEGKKIFTLSSRTVEEQKVVLANTEKGDLLAIISDHFVKENGAINEKEMFAKILGKLDCPASDVMFITDKFESALAASETGFIVALIVSKDGTAQQDQNNITVINSLTDIEFGTSTKKRKVSNEGEDVPICEPSISNETADVEMIAVDNDNSGIKDKDEPSTHAERHEIEKSEVGEKPEAVKPSESLATNEHIKENGTMDNQCSPSDIETTNTMNKIESEKSEVEIEETEKLSSEMNTTNADITANNKMNSEQPEIENEEMSNTEPQSKNIDITPTEPDTESNVKNVGNPEIKETLGGEQTSEIKTANVDLSTAKSDSNKVVEETKADNATASTEKNVENPKGKDENSTADITEQTKSSEEANVDTCSATSSGVIKEDDKAEKIDSEMNTSNMDIDETTCSTEPKITDTEKDLKNIDEQLNDKLPSESNMEVDISENSSTPQNPSEDVSAKTLHQTESDTVNVKKDTEEVCSSTVNAEVNVANSDSDKLSENTVADVCPTESKTVNTADKVKSSEIDTAAMDVDTDIKSAKISEAVKIDNLPSTDSDSAELKNGDQLQIEEDSSPSEVNKSDADIEPESKNIQTPSEINTNTEADKENEAKSCTPSTQITEVAVNETEKSDKEPESKHVEAEEKNSKNISLENSESENKANETKPLVEITNDQNIADPQDLAERSEETNKNIFNESRISNEEDKTESLNGNIENEKTQNGIVENGKLEKYVNENNEIINGGLPSSETKSVVENSLTTGSEIKA